MKLNLIIPFAILIPIFSYAGEEDTTSVNEMFSSKSIDSTYTIETKLNNDLVMKEDAESEAAPVLSYDLISFEENHLPVTEELFKKHISSSEFTVSMDYNHLVKRQIDYFGTRWQGKLKQMVTKSQYFFPLYEEILLEYDMPLEIKYLSVIESGLNPYAWSRVGAAGVWQFMPATGRIFDLSISSQLDERKSVEKSTRAACSYLKQMHNQYGDWLMALAAYNCGPGNVRKAMRYSGKRDFWGIYRYLPRETQNYVPKFIAMTYMMNFYSEYGITPAPFDEAQFNYEQVYCQVGLDFHTIAEKLCLTPKELMRYNPELKVEDIPYKGKAYILNVPANKTEEFYSQEKEIIAISKIRMEEKRIEEAKRPKVVYHYVRKGECLPIIARKHGCTVTQLKKWNGIRGTIIYPKQKLKIYRS